MDECFSLFVYLKNIYYLSDLLRVNPEVLYAICECMMPYLEIQR